MTQTRGEEISRSARRRDSTYFIMAERNTRVGQRIGNYRLTRLMGEGGFAQVYRGEHLQTQKLVAVKLLHTLPGPLDEAKIHKFHKEGRIVASLRHPHIVKVEHIGMEGDIPYLIMEFLPYGTLRRRHPEGSILKPTLVYSYIEKIADALHYAHSKGIVHRDVKPENILLNRRGELILSDFGIAFISQHNPEISQLSMPGVAGTYFYMAPEQWIEKPTYASDQYALAVTVYEWLCGERPYRGSPGSLLLQHLNVPPPLLRTRNAEISPALEEVVMKGLAKDANQRYASITEFACAFGKAAGLNVKDQSTVFTPPPPLQGEKVTKPPIPSLPEKDDIAQRPTHRLEHIEHSAGNRFALYGKYLARFKKGFSDATRTQLADPQRRKLLFGIAGVVALAGAGGFIWLGTNQQNQTGTPTQGQVLKTFSLNTTATSVAWSPRGTYLAVGNINSTIDIWEVQTGKHIYTYEGHTMRINDLAWSPGEAYVASASDDATIHVWNPRNGDLIQKYIGHISAVNTISWSPDAKAIASGSQDTTIQLWEPFSGNVLSRYEGHSHGVMALRWSPHGQQIASTALEENVVLVWDVTNRQSIASHQHSETVLTLEWSPGSGTYLASGGRDRQVHVWKANDGQMVTTYTKHTEVVRALSWSKDATKLASGSNDHTIQVWQALDSQSIYTYQTPNTIAYSLAWSPIDTTNIASGGDDKKVQIWRAVQ